MANHTVSATVAYDDYGDTRYRAEIVEFKVTNTEPPGKLSDKGLIFVIDASISMGEQSRMTTVKTCLSITLDMLASEISGMNSEEIGLMETLEKAEYLKQIGYLAFIIFSNKASLLWENTSEADPYGVVDSLRPIESTNLYAGVELALQKTREHPKPTTVVILTDGETNKGLVDRPSFISLYEKFDTSHTLISAGIGNDYRSTLISLVPLNFSHVKDSSVVPEFIASVVSEFISANCVNAKIEVIDCPIHKVLVGKPHLGTMMTDQERVLMFSAFPSSKHGDHDPDQRIKDTAQIRFSYTRFDGTMSSETFLIQRSTCLHDDSIERYYREEAIRLIAYLSVNNQETNIKGITAIVEAWDRPGAGPYRDSVLEFIQQLKDGDPKAKQNNVDHLLSQASSQKAYTPTSMPSLTPVAPKGRDRLHDQFLDLAAKHVQKTPSAPEPSSSFSSYVPSMLPGFR
jgi:hypothetical protein